MAEAAVLLAVQKLGEFLMEKAVRVLRIKDDVEWLRDELRFMQSFLKDAEENQTTDHRVQQWMSEITELAEDTVCILNDFFTQEGAGQAPMHGIFYRVKRYFCFCEIKANANEMSNKIESLRNRVLDLSRKRETYGITSLVISDVGESRISNASSGSMSMRMPRRTTSYKEEEHVVGFEDVTQLLLEELLKDEDRRSVISIYGMGGLGKTTLARKLYNSSDIQKRFACRAWVCVSQDFSIQDLLRAVIKSLMGFCKEELDMLEKLNEEDLERYLRQFLKEHKYLVVIDDLWQKEDWESLKRAFPDCQNGSRVIITTRKKDVAERVDERSFVHRLRFLTPEESWDLFIKKISHGDRHAHWFSPAMEDMGKEMAAKCRGLPLAIVVLGGLLSNKDNIEKWHRVKEQLWQHMKDDSIEISFLLSLSYNDLRSALKKCFLYVGIFPEDYVINAEKLMWLWMAEKFIPHTDNMEDIAEEYLQELINRSLIQVADRCWGRIRACTVHDLLRDLAVEKAMEVNLFDIYDPRVYTTASSRRRCAIHTRVEKFFSVGLSNEGLRSLVFFNPDFEHPNVGNVPIICERFKYLHILDLENVCFSHPFDDCCLPDAIGDLIYLKFLGLINTHFNEFPPTIGNLKSLQTLETSVFDSTPCRFPMEISKLINLRHLYMHRSEGPLRVDSLTNLRTLKGVSYDQWIDIDTSNLINLRELVIVNIQRPQAPTCNAYSLDSISNLKSLTTLCLQSYRTLPPLEPLCSCPNLLKLWLKGKMRKLPAFNELPQSLTMLKLTRSRLSEDPMPTLEKLLNLRNLVLEDAYNGKEIACSKNGFPQLEYLRLSSLSNVENWRLAKGAMPVVRRLSISDCPKLKGAIPKRMQSIALFEELEHSNSMHFCR